MMRSIFISALLAASTFAGTPEAMSLLKANCFSCHNSDKKKGGLDLTTRTAAFRGSEEGKVLLPGKASASRLIQALQPASDPHMPPKDQLSPRAITALSDWVDAGAEWDHAFLKDRPRPAHDKLAALPKGYSPVLGVALSPDAKRLAIARGSMVVVHDLSQTIKVVATLAGHRDAVQSIAWSPDGQWLATGGYRRVRLWNAELKLARELTALDGRVTALQFADDNATLFTADGAPASSGMVRQWKLADGARLAEWRAHGDTIYGMAISRDGKQLATAGADGVAKVWNLATRKVTAQLEGHHGAVFGVAFNSDGRKLATASADHELLVWDLKTRQKITEIRVHKGGVTALRWTPDDQALVTACEDGVVRVFTDIKSHDGAQRSGTAREGKLSGATGRLHAVDVSADAKLVVTGGQNGAVYLWRDHKLAATLKGE
jgi:WD40 repeat protein